MILTHIGNACCVYEHMGYKILCDPWLTEGAFEGSWFHYPLLRSKPSNFFDVNAIYLSHLHPDHFDETSLKEFPKTIPIIYLKNSKYLERKIKALGFTHLCPLEDKEARFFGPFEVTMYKPFIGNLFHESQIGNPLDSAIVVRLGDCKILNANDNPPTEESARMLHEKHGAFDLIQLVDSTAGPYPACFLNLHHDERILEAKRILDRHLELMFKCAHILKTRYMQPFAGHYQLGGRFLHLNPYLGVIDTNEMANRIAENGLRALPLQESDTYDFENDKMSIQPFVKTDREIWTQKVRNARFTYDDMEVDPDLNTKLFLSHKRMMAKQKELNCFPQWSCNINGIYPFNFDGTDPIEPYENSIRFILDPKALSAVVNNKIHWNNLEVGCHIQMYRTPNVYNPDIHLLMSFFHV